FANARDSIGGFLNGGHFAREPCRHLLIRPSCTLGGRGDRLIGPAPVLSERRRLDVICSVLKAFECGLSVFYLPVLNLDRTCYRPVHYLHRHHVERVVEPEGRVGPVFTQTRSKSDIRVPIRIKAIIPESKFSQRIVSLVKRFSSVQLLLPAKSEFQAVT